MDAVVSSKSLLRTGCPSKSDEELPCQKLAKHSLTWQVPVGCVSIFLDKNRRYIGKSQSVRRKGISGAWMEAGGAYKHRPAVTSLMSSSVSANSSSASLAGRPRCRANSPFVSMRPPASTSWVCGAARACQFEERGGGGCCAFGVRRLGGRERGAGHLDRQRQQPIDKLLLGDLAIPVRVQLLHQLRLQLLHRASFQGGVHVPHDLPDLALNIS
jgi:hypothetical protein